MSTKHTVLSAHEATRGNGRYITLSRYARPHAAHFVARTFTTRLVCSDSSHAVISVAASADALKECTEPFAITRDGQWWACCRTEEGWTWAELADTPIRAARLDRFTVPGRCAQHDLAVLCHIEPSTDTRSGKGLSAWLSATHFNYSAEELYVLTAAAAVMEIAKGRLSDEVADARLTNEAMVEYVENARAHRIAGEEPEAFAAARSYVRTALSGLARKHGLRFYAYPVALVLGLEPLPHLGAVYTRDVPGCFQVGHGLCTPVKKGVRLSYVLMAIAEAKEAGNEEALAAMPCLFVISPVRLQRHSAVQESESDSALTAEAAAPAASADASAQTTRQHRITAYNNDRYVQPAEVCSTITTALETAKRMTRNRRRTRNSGRLEEESEEEEPVSTTEQPCHQLMSDMSPDSDRVSEPLIRRRRVAGMPLPEFWSVFTAPHTVAPLVRTDAPLTPQTRYHHEEGVLRRVSDAALHTPPPATSNRSLDIQASVHVQRTLAVRSHQVVSLFARFAQYCKEKGCDERIGQTMAMLGAIAADSGSVAE